MNGDRERAVTDAFVALASDLANGYDVLEMLNGLTSSCARLLDVSSAGLLLADGRRVLHVMAASSEATRTLELFQLQREQGPCLDCYHTATPVIVPDLSREDDRWPQFVAAARTLGFMSVHAVPMRLRDNTLGALGLFGSEIGALNAQDLSLAQALADVASVALVHDKAASDPQLVNTQLQTALNSRVVIEQAKGILAQLGALSMDEAFAAIRRYARDHNYRLTELAQAVVARTRGPSDILDHAARKGSRDVATPPR